jgi:hypothetical protein
MSLGGWMYDGVDRHTVLGLVEILMFQVWDLDTTQMKDALYLILLGYKEFLKAIVLLIM